jgi:hypothetical protein
MIIHGCAKEQITLPTLNINPESTVINSSIKDIPDIENFILLLNDISGKIDSSEIKEFTYLRCREYEDGIDCRFSFPYKDGSAYAYFAYIYDSEEWVAIWVVNSSDLEVYYVGDGFEDQLPIMSFSD